MSGLLGGKVDRLMMNFVDILYGIPSVIYVILLMVFLKPGLLNIFLAMGIAGWLGMARMVRGQILSLKEQEFVWQHIPLEQIGKESFGSIFYLMPWVSL